MLISLLVKKLGLHTSQLAPAGCCIAATLATTEGFLVKESLVLSSFVTAHRAQPVGITLAHRFSLFAKLRCETAKMSQRIHRVDCWHLIAARLAVCVNSITDRYIGLSKDMFLSFCKIGAGPLVRKPVTQLC
jgi:hypothetical protein